MVLGLDRNGSSPLDWGRSPALVAAVSVAKTEGYSGRDTNDRLASVPAMAPPSAGISGTLWWLKRPDNPIRPLGPDLLLSLTQEGGGQTLCSVSTYSLVPAALLAACPTLDASRSPDLRLSFIAIRPC